MWFGNGNDDSMLSRVATFDDKIKSMLQNQVLEGFLKKKG